MTDTAQPGAEPDISTSRYIAQLMDSTIKIPGTGFAIGLDGILGIIPVIGDLITGAAGAFILVDAAKHKVPPETMGKMAANLGGDIIAGAAIPVAGDLFDIVWKANRKNLTLLEDHLGLPRTYAKGGDDMPTEARYRPKAPRRAVSLTSFVLGGSGAGGGGGGTDASAVDSAEAGRPAEFVRYTFVADRVERRTETHIRGGGGGGMIQTVGGQTSGHIAPVTINSWTTHTNEVWYTQEDGTETFLLLDANAIPIRSGQKISLVFTAAPHLKGKMALTIVRNHSMGQTKVYPGTQRAQRISGHGFAPVMTALIALSFGAALLAGFGGGAVFLAMLLIIPGAVLGFREGRRVERKTAGFLAEAAAFAEDG
ncbi:MAG: DUF4112 domain-containing protein [Pseudomonadota bacterium]